MRNTHFLAIFLAFSTLQPSSSYAMKAFASSVSTWSDSIQVLFSSGTIPLLKALEDGLSLTLSSNGRFQEDPTSILRKAMAATPAGTYGGFPSFKINLFLEEEYANHLLLENLGSQIPPQSSISEQIQLAQSLVEKMNLPNSLAQQTFLAIQQAQAAAIREAETQMTAEWLEVQSTNTEALPIRPRAAGAFGARAPSDDESPLFSASTSIHRASLERIMADLETEDRSPSGESKEDSSQNKPIFFLKWINVTLSHEGKWIGISPSETCRLFARVDQKAILPKNILRFFANAYFNRLVLQRFSSINQNAQQQIHETDAFLEEMRHAGAPAGSLSLAKQTLFIISRAYYGTLDEKVKSAEKLESVSGKEEEFEIVEAPKSTRD